MTDHETYIRGGCAAMSRFLTFVVAEAQYQDEMGGSWDPGSSRADTLVRAFETGRLRAVWSD